MQIDIKRLICITDKNMNFLQQESQQNLNCLRSTESYQRLSNQSAIFIDLIVNVEAKT